ncbi:MAG TPA: hypothetical protein VMH36_06160 [Alphaproteobacteria bacterium]|nr:hypothetical protein [Alphaproteobacteria bacterium]
MSESAPDARNTSEALAALEIERLALAFNGLQDALPYTLWPYLGQALAAATTRTAPELAGPKLDRYDTKLQLLRTRGLTALGQVLERGQLDDIHRHFAARPCFAAHIAAKGDNVERTLDECQALGPQATYRLADIVAAPHLIELANREDMLSLMEAYLGCVPSIYSMNAFWTFPGHDGLIPGLQTYHRDMDDFRFCTLFVFLTDLAPGDGAHYFVRGSHRIDLVERQLRQANPQADCAAELERLFAKVAAVDDATLAALHPQIETVAGPAGTAVFEDTYGLHKGDVPKTKRLLAWIRYGLYRNWASFTDKVTPVPRRLVAGRIPDTPRHRYINRLIIEA